ncbi:MAG: hypothetical protein ACP5H4_06120, partial [Sulfurihydrogenibium sp.]
QYKKILEELYQSFITRFKNPHLSDELEQKAIDKMKHFGWIAEKLSEKGYEIKVKKDFYLYLNRQTLRT